MQMPLFSQMATTENGSLSRKDPHMLNELTQKVDYKEKQFKANLFR